MNHLETLHLVKIAGMQLPTNNVGIPEDTIAPLPTGDVGQANQFNNIGKSPPVPMTDVSPKFNEPGYEAPANSIKGFGQRASQFRGDKMNQIGGVYDGIDRSIGAGVDHVQKAWDGRPFDDRSQPGSGPLASWTRRNLTDNNASNQDFELDYVPSSEWADTPTQAPYSEDPDVQYALNNMDFSGEQPVDPRERGNLISRFARPSNTRTVRVPPPSSSSIGSKAKNIFNSLKQPFNRPSNPIQNYINNLKQQQRPTAVAPVSN